MSSQITILFSGQTDAGKSTIIGHLLYKHNYKWETTKSIKNIHESSDKSKWSRLLDIDDIDEIGVNKTKTVIFKSFDLDIQMDDTILSYQIIDTPGHHIYIRQLIEGLFRPIPINVVCLVISSIQREFYESFERGTVREDLLLAKSAGIQILVILWNKTDLNTPTDDMIKTIEMYCKQLKFKTVLQHHVSGYYGTGLDELLPFITKHIPKQPESQPILRNPFSHSHPPSLNIKILFVFPPKCNLIISAGFLCMLHSIGGEFEMIIVKMYIPEPFIRATKPPNGAIDILVKLSTKDNLAKLAPRDRIVLRKDTETIGFGIIVT